MQIIRDPKAMQRYALECKRQGIRLGLVPTMGFLHDGHLSLIDKAREKTDEVMVSIFVNPIQFGVNEDLDRYPRDFDRDCRLCEERGAAVVFAPEPDDMYPAGFSCYVEETRLSQNLCGASRPGHFRGVTTVVAKLFNLTLPEVAVFGQKDAQQALVLRRMVRDLDFPIEMVIAPLVRDHDGIALSSRNKYLSAAERERARVLSRSLFAAVPALGGAGVEVVPGVRAAIEYELRQYADRVDYVEILDAETLTEPDANTEEVIVALAACFGRTRLIDNAIVKITGNE